MECLGDLGALKVYPSTAFSYPTTNPPQLRPQFKPNQVMQFAVKIEADELPKYFVLLVDSDKSPSMAAFIVPQGKERAWIFSDTDGLKELIAQ
mmetsp:Transcript_23893/g.42300  ORF Transcript_23893/g.42300 Transcript_23893/m.42300 type:complete len:93 (+) Transcript_23893:7-285(+)